VATFRVTSPDGRTVKLTGQNPPTAAQLETIFSKIEGGRENPINESPLTQRQRLGIGFGTDQGNLDFLKDNYEDAVQQDNGKFLVKQDGRWHKVDEKGASLGDITESVGKGVVALAAGLGEIAGLPGGPAGVIAGGIAGGAGGEVIRQKIGQKLGTVDQLRGSEIAFEGALGGVGAGLGVAVTKFGGKGLNQVARQIKDAGVDLDPVISNAWDRVIGVSDGSTRTLLDNIDEVTNFKKWAASGGSDKSLEIADDVVRFVKNQSKELTDIKRSASIRANKQGIKVTPSEILNQQIDEAGTTLQDFLQQSRVGIDEKADPLAINSPTIKKLTRLLDNPDLGFKDVDDAISLIDQNVKYNAIPDKEKIAERPLKKIRLALKKSRNESFGVAEDFEELRNIIKSIQTADGKSIFGNVKQTDSILRNLDSPANERTKGILNELGKMNPAFSDILEKRRIWKASNEFNKLVPSTQGGFGTGAGRANQIRSQFQIGAGITGAAVGGPVAGIGAAGLAGLGLSPRATAGAVRGATRATRVAVPAVRQGTIRGGLSALGL